MFTPFLKDRPVIFYKGKFLNAFIFVLMLLTAVAGCQRPKDIIPRQLNNFAQVNLVTDQAGMGADRIDSSLVNPWGIAFSASGTFWISANHTGLTTVYDKTGKTVLAAVTVPSQNVKMIGSPTGVVFNSTADFIIPDNNQKGRFIFAGEDGVISAWSSGTSAIKVADRSAFDAVYKGLALATDGAANFLYAANFKGGKIDVFDKDFHYVSGKSFWDPDIPGGFAPFNIRNIGGKLYVTYARQKGPDNEDDQSGAGNGYVDIFNTDGSLVKRFASKGPLNSPWGIVQVPQAMGEFQNSIFIGNFGDGRINVYNQNGNFQGQLKDNGKVISIDGLWALETNIPSTDPGQIYFSAGPNGEEHGLFGYLKSR